VRREQGVAGQPHDQSEHAEQGSVHDLASASLALPGPRLQVRVHAFHDWRRDTFADPASENGLGYQDNRDVTQSFGGHAETSVFLPALQWVGVSLDARHESFLPWRGYPRPEHAVPEQSRTVTELGLENRLQVLGGRLRLQGDLRRIRAADDFSGDVTTAHSRHPAVSAEREYLEPQAGLRLRLLPGVHVEWSYGEHHRTPGFLELFGDAGAIAGSSDLVAEEGTHRDYGLDLEQPILGLQVQAELAHYSNRTDHLITYIPTSQRVFVARNIGSARMQGEEAAWRIAPRGDRPRWRFEGSYTHQHTEDLGVDRSWYAGNALPGRPEHRLHTRFGVALGPAAVAYQYDHMGRNYLDQLNLMVVGRRDLHGLDLDVRMRAVTLRLAGRNLTNDQAVDVAGFPVPGRTWSLSSAIRF